MYFVGRISFGQNDLKKLYTQNWEKSRDCGVANMLYKKCGKLSKIVVNFTK